MSAINGDKARFNRGRKAKIARRARNRKQFENVKQQPSSGSVARGSKVSA
jgi:hypothetical protein